MSSDRPRSVVRWPRPAPTAGASPRDVEDASLGATVLGVAVGVPWTLSAMILWGRKAVDPALAARFTRAGRLAFRPERDMAIYLAGCAATLLIVLGLDRAWRTRLRRLGPAEAGPFLRRCAARSGSLAILAAGSYLAAFKLARPPIARVGPTPGYALLVFLPGALALIAAWLGSRSGPGPAAAVPEGPEGCRGPGPTGGEGMAPAPGRAGGLRDWATGLGTAALLVAILYVPSYRQLAGKIMALDLEPFHHWDFFAMGPAVGYATGGALGTEVYSQYGVGWPVLLAAIAPAIPLGYGNALHVANIYILTYFLGIYLFLRLWLGEGAWAAAGSLATAYMLMYESAMPGVGVWMHPNSTALRSPTDVWFFLGMWLHLRSGRPRWAAFMGAAAGLGIVFATDTGLLLVATMVAYLARPKPGEPGPGGPGVRRGRGAIGLAVGPAVAAIAALGGLAIASRGTILRPEFWRGWLEAITDYGGGIGALPMADLTDRPTLVLFLVMVGTYLATLGVLAVALLHGRADRGRVLAGGLAIYGLARMVYFVNRSHPYNFPHASAPFCLIATWATRLAWRRASGGVPGRGLAPGIAIVLALALLAANPNFRGFPSLAREIVRGRPEAGLRLMPDVCGLPPGSRPTVEEFAAVTSRLASLKSRGASVAVLDMADTMDYLASGCAPPARYIPLLPGLLRRDQLERAEARLLAEKVDWIFSSLPAPGRDQDESPHGDVFRVFSELLRRHYVPVDRIGRFTIWRRASAGPGSARRARSEGGPGSRTVP